MLNGGNFDETRRRTIKLTLDALTYSLLSFIFGLACFSIKNAKIVFTDIEIPSSLFQILSIVYFLLFFVFSAALLLPVLMESIDQLIDWVSSSVLWHILTAVPFLLILGFTLNSLVQGEITLATSIFSLPVEYIAAGWFTYITIVIVTDMVKPDWREAIGNLLGGASSRNSDYLTRQLDRDRPAEPMKSEGRDMSYLNGGGGGSRINWAFLLTGVFAVVVAGGFGYYYWQTTNTITARNLTIAQQQTQIAGLQTDLATSQANATSLLEQLNSNVTALNGANVQIQQLNTASQAQAASLGSQLATLTADKTALQTQVTSLQSQVDTMTPIVNLSASSTQASNVIATLTTATTYPVASFTANYAGYLYITGTSSSVNGYIVVSDSSSYYPSVFSSNHYPMGDNVYVPVLPGTINVYFGTMDAAGATANVSVIYYY